MSKYDKYFDKIKELHSKGYKNIDIGKSIGINPKRVGEQLKKNGIKRNDVAYEEPNKNEKEVLITLAIGDGCIFKSKASKNYRINLAHSEKQRLYFLKKYNELKRFIEVDYFKQTQTHSKNGKKYTCYKFQSRVNPYYTKLRNVFYKDNKKVIPKNFDKMITEKIIAYKYFDDGNKTQSGYSIAMDDYDIESVKNLKKAIKKKTGIECNIHGSKSLYVPAKYREQFKKILIENATDDLKYKIF